MSTRVQLSVLNLVKYVRSNEDELNRILGNIIRSVSTRGGGGGGGGGARFLVGRSIHEPRQVAGLVDSGVDYLVLGSVYETASHPGGRPIGAGAVAEAVAAATVPVLAIGGVGPGDVPGLLALGAHGVVVKSGVWRADDPARAVTRYLDMLHVEG